MKKFYMLFIGAAILGSATVSCNKIDPVVPDDPVKEEDVNEGNENQTPADGTVLLTFSVSQEGDANDESTKTSWDGATHAWSAGDQIRIIWGEGESDYVDAEVVDGKVSATVADADYYYAVYPTSADYTFTAAEGKISVSFGRNQSGSFADANIMAAKTSKSAAAFSFKNMTSILKFSTGASAAYTKVTFAANDLAKLNGTVSTTFDEPFTVQNAGTNGDLLTVDGVTAGNTYYVAVLPGITLANGLGFKVNATNQDTGALSTGSLIMGRSSVKNLGVIDNMIHKDWFIKEGGTGKGTSWEDAGGAERLVQLIYPTQSRGTGSGLTAAYRLHKATIHVAAGTYNIQAANDDEVLAPHYSTGSLDFTIKGGYPTNLSGTATTGQDPANNATNFICNQVDAADRVFLLSDANEIPSVTFDGITFPANGASLAPGTAFDFNSTAASTVKFKSCTFSGFVQSGTVNGGPVYVQNTGAATINFDGCTFSGNTCNTGGAIYLYNANATVSFTDCSFSGNEAKQAGGAMRARSFASLTITGGSFSNNVLTATGNNGYGAAISVDAGTVDVVGTKFIGNRSNIGSALYVTGSSDSNKGVLRVFNSLFDGNEATATDGSGSTQKGCTVYANQCSRVLLANCTLRNNKEHNASHGVVSPKATTAKVYLVSCTLSENLKEVDSVVSAGNDIARTTNLITVHNTIATNTDADIKNVVRDYSIFTLRRFAEDKDNYSDMTAFALKSFNNDVYPLNSTYSTDYNSGMSVTALQALEFDGITLTDDQKALLAKDQKGNDRKGTIMGAYVLTK